MARSVPLLAAFLLLAGCGSARRWEPLPPSPIVNTEDHYVVVTVENNSLGWVTLYAASGMARSFMGTVPPGYTDRLVLLPQVADGCCLAKTADDRYADRRIVRITRRNVPREEIMAVTKN